MAAPRPGAIYDADGVELQSPDEIADAIAKGRAQFRAGDDVPMLNPEGEPVWVPAETAGSRMSAGYTYETAEMEHARKLRQEVAGSPAAMATHFAEKAAGTLSLGLSDVAARDIAEATGGEAGRKEYLAARRAREEALPAIGAAGTVAGLATPFAAEALAARGVEGAGALALQAAAAPTRAVTAVGGLAERLAGAMVGTEAKGLAGIAQRAVGYAARGTAEGSIYGAGNAISEAALGDKDMTAEMLWAGIKSGAGLGAILGGTLGGIAAGTQKLAPLAAKELRRTAMSQELKAAGGIGSDLKQIARRMGLGGEERLERLATRAREEFKWYDLSTARTSKLEQRLTEAGEKLEKMRSRVSELDAKAVAAGEASEAATGLAKVIRTTEQEQLAPLRNGLGDEVRVAKRLDRDILQPMRDALAAETPVTFDRMLEWRQKIDKLVNYEQPLGKATAYSTELAKLRKSLENEIERGSDVVAARAGEKFTEGYRAAKQEYGELADLKKLKEGELGRELGNRTISLSDTIMGGAGLVAAGGGGLLAAAANKLLRSAPASALASRAATVMADAAERLSGAARAADTVGIKIQNDARKALLGPHVETLAPLKRSANGVREASYGAYARSIPTRVAIEYEKQWKKVKEAQARPEVAMDKIQNQMQGLAVVAPRTVASMTSVAMRGQAYLASIAPKASAPTGLFAGARTDDVAEADKARFLRAARIVANPLIALDLMKQGKLDQTSVDALRNVYPKLYERMKSEVVAGVTNLAQRGQVAPYQQRLQLSRLFGVPLDRTEEPAFVSAMQNMHGVAQAQEQQGGATPLRPSKRQSKLGARRRTRAEALEAGIE